MTILKYERFGFARQHEGGPALSKIDRPEHVGQANLSGLQGLNRRMAYFALSEYYRPVPELDEWIRRRLRMCYWKQWRRCRKRARELLKLGVNERQAVLTSLSRKSCWHISRTKATQMGLNDAWLKSQGLVSVRELWIAFHYPAANQSRVAAS